MIVPEVLQYHTPVCLPLTVSIRKYKISFLTQMFIYCLIVLHDLDIILNIIKEEFNYSGTSLCKGTPLGPVKLIFM